MAKSPKERGLGKGLGALLSSAQPVSTTPDTELAKNGNDKIAEAVKVAESKGPDPAPDPESAKDRVIYVGINDVKPNSDQPRKNFDEEKISELADSIKEHGIIQPLIVREAKTGYEIVAGERRYRAARKAGLKKIPCIVREFTDEENMVIAIIENMQREDLDPIEEAQGLNRMIEIHGMTQEEVSKTIGKSRPYIANSLRLLNLSQDIMDLMIAGSLTAGHGRALLAIEDKEERSKLAKKIANEGLSVREVEKIAAVSTKAPAKRKVSRSKSRDIISVEDELKDLFGTKVNIKGRASKGAIELEYYSLDELNRLIDILRTVKA